MGRGNGPPRPSEHRGVGGARWILEGRSSPLEATKLAKRGGQCALALVTHITLCGSS